MSLGEVRGGGREGRGRRGGARDRVRRAPHAWSGVTPSPRGAAREFPSVLDAGLCLTTARGVLGDPSPRSAGSG